MSYNSVNMKSEMVAKINRTEKKRKTVPKIDVTSPLCTTQRPPVKNPNDPITWSGVESVNATKLFLPRTN